MYQKGFASDNNSGISPEVLAKIAEVNTGHVISYGDDPYTREAVVLIKKYFGENVMPYFVFTGTAANVLGIAGSVKSFQSVFCSETAHIHVDECGAPERFGGCKIIPLASSNGKLTSTILQKHMSGFGFEHHSQPALVSISQPTELGTVYSVDEIKNLAEFIHEYGLYLHMDGARLANAAVFLDRAFKEFTFNAGVDILSFGGSKNGLMAAESVIFSDVKKAGEFKYIRKQGMQLASKMRFISAQFIAYLEDDLWKRNAENANRMAQKLYSLIINIPQVKVTQQVNANSVFCSIPPEIIKDLKCDFNFYTWNEQKNEVRWMTSFDTTEADIDLFVNRLRELVVLHFGE